MSSDALNLLHSPGGGAYLTLVNEDSRQYKWYHVALTYAEVSLFPKFVVSIKWGRIGDEGVEVRREFDDEAAATRFAVGKINEKLRKGYVAAEPAAAHERSDCALCRLLRKRSLDDCFIIDLRRTMVFLNWDQSYKGRLMLVLKTHVRDFFSLSQPELLAVIRELRIVERAVHASLRPAMLNYLFMGNKAEHAHLHVVPRYRDDQNYGESPFLDTSRAERPQLLSEQYRALALEIRQHIASDAP